MSTLSTQNKLEAISSKNENTKESTLKDFFTPEFISKYSNFMDMEHLFNESNFKIQTEKDIDEVLHDELNTFIFEHTSFDSWNEMQKTAMDFCIKK